MHHRCPTARSVVSSPLCRRTNGVGLREEVTGGGGRRDPPDPHPRRPPFQVLRRLHPPRPPRRPRRARPPPLLHDRSSTPPREPPLPSFPPFPLQSSPILIRCAFPLLCRTWETSCTAAPQRPSWIWSAPLPSILPELSRGVCLWRSESPTWTPPLPT